MEVKTKKVGGLKVGYIDEGKGPLIIMVHGLSVSKESFIPLIERLKDQFRVIAVDMPGRGDSDNIKESYSLEFFLNVLERFVKGMKLKRFILLGISMGGGICLRYASLHPEIVSRLIVQAPFFHKDQIISSDVEPHYINSKVLRLLKMMIRNRWIQKLVIKKYKDQTRARVEEAFSRTELPAEEIREVTGRIMDVLDRSLDVRSFIEVYSEMRDIKIEGLSDINAPTLILWGEEDDIFSYENALELKELVKDSKVKVLRRCGHFMVIERPLKMAEIVKESFLD